MEPLKSRQRSEAAGQQLPHCWLAHRGGKSWTECKVAGLRAEGGDAHKSSNTYYRKLLLGEVVGAGREVNGDVTERNTDRSK